jgi:6-phosphofructokinase
VRTEEHVVSGKLLVGQAGGATAVINSSLAGVIEEAQRSGAFDAIWGMRRGAEGALQGDLVDLSRLTERQLRALARTPGAALASSRHKVTIDDAETLLQLFERHNIRSLLYIGGNDSADTVHRLAGMAAERGQSLHAIAVPKTIDNDLPVTDHSPGYGSIARYVAIAARDSAQDTESMPTMYPVKFIEVMGRNAGWVAAASTLGKRAPIDPPHLIYVPERPLTAAHLLDDVRRIHDLHGFVVAIVTETVRDPGGAPFADPAVSAERDPFGHPLLRGAADTMCRLVQDHLGLRARFDKPGSLQRMSMLCASSIDLAESAEVGRAAVRLALSGQTDRMVTLVRDADEPYAWHTDSASLSQIANRQRLVPDHFLTEDGRGTTEAFHRYARPLLGPEPLPAHIRLDAPPLRLAP